MPLILHLEEKATEQIAALFIASLSSTKSCEEVRRPSCSMERALPMPSKVGIRLALPRRLLETSGKSTVD